MTLANTIGLDKNVQEQAMKLLEALSSKMGLAVDQLWMMEVAHAYYSGLSSIFFSGVILALIAFITFHSIKFLKFTFTTKEHLSEGQVLASAGICVSFIFTAICTYINIYSIQNGFIMMAIPEHYALQSIVNAASGLIK